MAITTQLLGSIGFIRGHAAISVSPNVTYKLPPAPYGWVAIASGTQAVTVSWEDLSTRQTVSSYTGGNTGSASRTNANTKAQQLATTVGIGVRFSGPPSISVVGIAPIGPDGDAYAMPPT